jgi:hypothetical protein
MNRVALEAAKQSPDLQQLIASAPTVRIWTEQWRAWWRGNGSGYTDDAAQAGRYPGSDAWARSKHAGPEKGIVYELVD